MDNKTIINFEAWKLGKQMTSNDRVLIQKKLNLTESAVNKALSGKRKCIRGKSLKVFEMAEKIAEINKSKAELI